MRARVIAILVICLALAFPGTAGASSGPKLLQALAAAQTAYLFAHLKGTQSASPAVCGEGQPSSGFLGYFLLPTLSFSPGSRDFDCRITTRKVVLDLSGTPAIEDTTGDEWLLADGVTKLAFVPSNLERICDDVRPRYYKDQSPASLDGKPIVGKPVTTPAFPVPIRRTAPLTFWQDSVGLGHPGILTTTFCGWKAVLPLTRGTHEIVVDHSALFTDPPVPTIFRYKITVS